MNAPEPIRLRSLLASRRGAWSLSLLLGFITLLAVVSLLALSGWFISAAALAGLVSVGIGFDYFRPAAIIRLCAITRTAGRYAERLSSHYAALGLLKDLRVTRFNVMAQSKSPTRHSADSLQRLVSDIDLLDQFPLKVVAPWLWALLLTTLVMMFWAWLAQPLLLATLPLLLAALVVPPTTLHQALALAKQQADTAALRRQAALEPLSMLTNLRLWQRWQSAVQPFHRADQQLLALQQRQQQLISRSVLAQHCLLALALLALLWQGSSLLASGQLSVALLLAALLALWALYEVLTPLCHSFVALGLSMAARDRLNQLGDITVADNDKPQPTGPYRLTVEQLSARHPAALSGPDNISFALQSGQTLVINGTSGAGKSSLLQALAGDLPYQGQVTLNNKPLQHWQLSHCLGYLPQQPDIFDLTLAQNLRLGAPEASEQELWQVLEDVALKTWALSQPQQLDTLMGEFGTAVSGGQGRRIALARLLLTKRPILLLDEPFAGLDSITTQRVAKALQQRQQSGLLIIVSHQQFPLEHTIELRLPAE
ncbi:amino acid ABC transporter ATP-binding/permease protein [Rheinheimera maricola]|uniref:ATP-binding cassette domain-containing protein n=1 Tax=Rheinheimera maricola TaxID=2793282 RepID=A0ABS7X6V8_9GAMM|nr:ATP-binding cassette domain-containing protein [Rheinheimera maricola]MBZ9611290.1 ATP-binding cassette domain-containing protein [Rheinheimera maricola]